MSNLKAAGLVIWLVMLDQLSKIIFPLFFKLEVLYSSGGFFSIQPFYNESQMGGEEMFFATGQEELDKILFSAFFVLVSYIIVFVFYRLFKGTNELIEQGSKTLILTSYGILTVIGGLFGNMIDRIRLQGVYDFIYIELSNRVIIFNVADIFIWTGFALIVLSIIVECVKVLSNKILNLKTN